jgi:plasmid stability protein
MAILNIKNFPDDLYDRLKDKAAEERRSVSQEVIVLLEDALNAVPSDSPPAE